MITVWERGEIKEEGKDGLRGKERGLCYVLLVFLVLLPTVVMLMVRVVVVVTLVVARFLSLLSIKSEPPHQAFRHPASLFSLIPDHLSSIIPFFPQILLLIYFSASHLQHLAVLTTHPSPHLTRHTHPASTTHPARFPPAPLRMHTHPMPRANACMNIYANQPLGSPVK